MFNENDTAVINSYAKYDDYYCRRGRWAVLNKFCLTWFWMRHQYSDWLMSMTDWFIIILGFTLIFDYDKIEDGNGNLVNDEEDKDNKENIRKGRIDMKNYEISLSKAIRRSIKLLATDGLRSDLEVGKLIY